MYEDYQDLDLEPLLGNDDLARKIIHRLQQGQNIDYFLTTEFRFLENYYQSWQTLFSFLGYRLEKSELGGEPFYYLEAASPRVNISALRRGATFLGLFLAWNFLAAGIDHKDHVRAEEVLARLRNSFDFNLLIQIFHPQQKANIRLRQESRKQEENLKKWILTGLRQLHRYRFIELKPSIQADWDQLDIFRLPGLQRFWEPARKALELDLQESGEEELSEAVSRIWQRVEWEEDNETGY